MEAKKVTRKKASASSKAPVKKPVAKKPVKGIAKKTPSTATSKRAAVKKKLLRLSVLEQSLLLHPPTEETWLCDKCEMILSGTNDRCWICGQTKTDILLWPIYEKACTKVGVPIGSLWYIKNKVNGLVMTREPTGKWKITDIPDGYRL